MIEPGSASRVPAGRFAACKNARRKCAAFFAAAVPQRQTRCRTPRCGVCAHLVCLYLKGETPMARVKRGTKRRAKRKKYLKRTKGFFLTKSKLYQSAQEAANRADRYAFRDRRVKKRQYRRLWIQRVGAAARLNGLTYGQLIHGLKAAGVTLDRKVLADIAVKDAAGFAALAETARAAAPPVKKAKRRPAA